MTSDTGTVRPVTATAALTRVANVVRLHLTQRSQLLVLPWMILGFIFLVNLVIWWLVLASSAPAELASVSQGMQFSGASTFIFVYMLVVAVQAINVTFPFALGYGVTRRDFYLGSAATFVLLSVYYALGMTLLATIERATAGWGLGGSMFDVVYFGSGTAAQQFALFLLGFLFFFFIGAATAAVYVRWRSRGMLVFFAALTLILVGLSVLATSTASWPLVGEWFARSGALGVAVWSLVPTTLAAVAGFVLLRRATPRN